MTTPRIRRLTSRAGVFAACALWAPLLAQLDAQAPAPEVPRGG